MPYCLSYSRMCAIHSRTKPNEANTSNWNDPHRVFLRHRAASGCFGQWTGGSFQRAASQCFDTHSNGHDHRDPHIDGDRNRDRHFHCYSNPDCYLDRDCDYYGYCDRHRDSDRYFHGDSHPYRDGYLRTVRRPTM